MYGLENKKKKSFVFDLENDLKKNPKNAKEVFDKVDANINEIKTSLRKGEKSADFENLGVVLQGYTALQKVLKRATKK
jgi:transcription termination factor NusB